MKHRSTLVAALMSSVLMTGCGGILNIGEPEFNCPAQNTTGLGCMSVRELYKATDGPLNSIGTKSKQAATAGTENSASKDKAAKAKEEADVVASYEPTPWMEKPMPIRSQAKVMRIWVAPYEDEAGDLNAPGLVFTEIEPRRWNVGEGLVKRPAKVSLASIGAPASGGNDNGASSQPFGVTNASGQNIGGLKNGAQNGKQPGTAQAIPKPTP